MAKTLINVKADKEVKKNAQKIADDLGLSLSDVINASLRNFIRTREVRFSAVPEMTTELERLLGVVEQDIKSKRGLSRAMSTKEEIGRRLDSL
jgi:addiction module RelB/DinJ family antitoxin